LIEEGIMNLERFKLSMSMWKKKLPSKINEDKPVSKSAAEIVAQHQEVGVEDLLKFVDVDSRVVTNLNVILKYRTAI
jgi:hypothetical protein